MKQVFADGNKNTVKKLVRLRKQAHAEKEPRVALRIQGIIFSIEGYPAPEIASMLKTSKGTVQPWIKNWNEYREEGLLEGFRCGRNPRLSQQQSGKLFDIIESGPISYGFNSGVWTSPMVTNVINDEFDITYHPGHVRKILKRLGFSVQRPTLELINKKPAEGRKWLRYRYPNLKKKPKMKVE